MKRRLSVLATTAALLGSCAPPGYMYDAGSFVPRPRDDCARREIAESIVTLLNARIGKPEGPPARVLSAAGFTTIGNDAPIAPYIYGPMLTCHGTLETTGGASGPGAVQLRMPDSGNPNTRDAAWETDASHTQKEAAARASLAAQAATLEPIAMRAAVRKYCATATPLACSTYTSQAADKESRCVHYSGTGYGMLSYQLTMIQAGMTPQQAAELSARNAGSIPGLSGADISDLALKAEKVIRVSAFIAPASFRDELLVECRKVAFGQ